MQGNSNSGTDEPTGSLLADPHILGVFKLEVWRQCRFALMAAADIEATVAELDDDSKHVDDGGERIMRLTERVFFALQSLLAAVANLSKLLWGSKKQQPSRQPLREALEIGEDFSPSIRRMRDQFEHFDSELEEWARGANHNYVDMNLGEVSGMSTSLLRNLDPDQLVATFRDEQLELKPIIAAVEALAERAKPDHILRTEAAQERLVQLRAEGWIP